MHATKPTNPDLRFARVPGIGPVKTGTLRFPERMTNFPDEIREAIEEAPRGSYQEAIIDGYQSWSGADLKGKAAEYGAKYAASRAALLDQIRTNLPGGWGAVVHPTWDSRSQRFVTALLLVTLDGDGLPVAYRW